MATVSEEQLEGLHRAFKRIFALPLSRMTLLEVQNAIRDTFPGKQEVIRAFYESLLSGEVSSLIQNPNDLQSFIEEYTSITRIAKEIADTGEFLNSFSCDFLPQGNRVFFSNRMRRVDAQEYHFLTTPETSIRLAHLFINRLRDLKQNAGSIEFPQAVKDELSNIKNDIDSILT